MNGEDLTAAEDLRGTVETGPKREKNTPLSAPDPEPPSCENSGFAGSQNSRTSSIDIDATLLDGRPEQNSQNATGTDETISNLERMGEKEKEMLEAAMVADTAMMASAPAIQPEMIAEVSTDVEERNRLEKERKEAIRMFTYETVNGKHRPDDSKIAEWIRLNFHTISFNKTVYIYDESGGIFCENNGKIEDEIRRIADLIDCHESITRLTREVVHRVTFTDPETIYPFNRQTDLIPVKNGAIRIDYNTGEITLLPPSPENKFTLCFPVKYDPKTDPEEFHREVIGRYLDEDQVEALYQIPACAILQMQGKSPYKRAYILQGPPNAGKTSYLEILYDFFGKENISGASIHDLGDDPFITSILEGKILNACDDLEDVPLKNNSKLKRLTGGFDHDIHRKHQNKYHGKIFALHIYTCNSPPSVPDSMLCDPAFWDRWIYLKFDNVFNVDPDLMSRLKTPENLSGFLNRVIATMIRIKRDGLIIAPDASTVKQTWTIAADPFLKFISEEMIGSSTETFFEKEVLLKTFIRWCDDRQVPSRKVPRTVTALSQAAFKHNFRTTKKRGREMYGALKTWRSGSPYEPSPESSAAGVNCNLDI